MKKKPTRYELMRVLDFLTLLGLICFIILFVNSVLDLATSFKSEVYSSMLTQFKFYPK